MLFCSFSKVMLESFAEPDEVLVSVELAAAA
jgi:hypothetical protein